MPSQILHEQAKNYVKNVPELRPGYTVRVHERIQEGGKERVQVFEGLVISVHNGHVPTDRSFTVRKVVSGIGVEKVFPLHAPTIEKIEVKKIAKVRRSKLFFLRGRAGKAARLNERFTTEDEFAIAVAEPEVVKTEEAPVAEQKEEVAEVAQEAPMAEAAPEVEEKKEEPAA